MAPIGRHTLWTALMPWRRHKGATMKPRRFALRLLVGGISVLALAGGTGVAQAQPDPTPPPVPSIIDQLVTSTPALSVSPSDDGSASTKWGGVGMFCQNLFVRCR